MRCRGEEATRGGRNRIPNSTLIMTVFSIIYEELFVRRTYLFITNVMLLWLFFYFLWRPIRPNHFGCVTFRIFFLLWRSDWDECGDSRFIAVAKFCSDITQRVVSRVDASSMDVLWSHLFSPADLCLLYRNIFAFSLFPFIGNSRNVEIFQFSNVSFPL
jgi:hypothetical protein